MRRIWIACLMVFTGIAATGAVELLARASPASPSERDTLTDSPELTAESAFVRDAKAAVDSLYNLKYDSARRLFSEWRRRYPSHPLWDFWKGMEIWWEILPDLHDDSKDAELFNQLEKANRAAEQVLEKHPRHRDALLLRALSKGLMARQYANRGRWLTSLNQARHAINSLSDLNELDAEIPDLLLGRGLLKYYAAYLPEAYPIVKTVSWILPKGDKAEGLELMKRSAEESIYVHPEALYFLGKIYMNHERDSPQALPYFKQLYERYPRNPYYATQFIRALVRSNRKSRAIQWIDKMLDGGDMPFETVLREELLAWKGRILFQRRNLDRATEILRESYLVAPTAGLPKGTNRPFHIMAGYYLGRSYELQGDLDKAVNYYSSVAEASPSTHYGEKADQRMQQLNK